MSTQPQNGPYDYIGIENVVASVKSQLRIEDVTDFDYKIEYYINECVQSFKTEPTYIKKPTTLEIEEGRANLPCGFVRLLGLKPVYEGADVSNPDDCCFNSRNSDLWYFEQAFLSTCGEVNPCSISRGNSYEIVGDQLIFTYPYPTNMTKVILSYEGMNTDENGLMMIPAEYEKACRNYASYYMLLIYPELYPNRFQPLYQRVISEYQSAYQRAMATVIAGYNRRDFERNKYHFRAIYHSLMQNRSQHV